MDAPRRIATVATGFLLGLSLGACDNPRANPAVREAETTSPAIAREPGVAPPPAAAFGPVPVAAAQPAPLSRSNTYTDDVDADGIAETRTIETWNYDPVARRCTQTVEIDFDADGTIDSRSEAVSGEAMAC